MFGTGEFPTARIPRAGAHGVRRLAFGLLAAGLLAALGASASVASATEPEDFSGSAYQILAPGDGGFPPPERAKSSTFDQGLLYDALTPLQGNVTAADLEKYYLSEKFGVTGPVIEEEHLAPGLVIKRDKNDIPHVYGATRELVMFGSGWVAAEDRGLLLKMAVGPSFAATLDIPGINPFGLLLTGREFTPSSQTVNFVNAQKSVLREKGPRGEQVLSDLEYWAAGVNAFEETFKEFLPPELRVPHLTSTNAIAGFALIGSIFGNGGGNEVTNSNLLAKLEAKLGSSKGLRSFATCARSTTPKRR
jgi:Penicillin amidase